MIILLIFCLQLEISFCDYMNLHSYFCSGNTFFLEVERISALEQYLIPFCEWLIEGWFSECTGDKIPRDPSLPPAEPAIDCKKYSADAGIVIDVIQGVSLGVAPVTVFKSVGGTTPMMIKSLPPALKTGSLLAMGVGGYILLEIAKAGK
jgi:hypothetical protein